MISGLCIELKRPQGKERALGLEDWGMWMPPAHGWVRRTFPKAEGGPQVPRMMGTHTSLPHSAPGRWQTSEESGCGEEAHKVPSPRYQDPQPRQSPCTHTVPGSSNKILLWEHVIRIWRLLNDCSALWKSSRAFTSWRESLNFILCHPRGMGDQRRFVFLYLLTSL